MFLFDFLFFVRMLFLLRILQKTSLAVTFEKGSRFHHPFHHGWSTYPNPYPPQKWLGSLMKTGLMKTYENHSHTIHGTGKYYEVIYYPAIRIPMNPSVQWLTLYPIEAPCVSRAAALRRR